MRIQHNIMAMNAYRNYTNNTSALAKNLEKLSSGYRINRAGDDAAGLAISEKMRAQITALGTAQKNVKDGISLVKTAEGATQEIHDMLNRMVSLAEQSANGTYQDAVDREAIEDEFNALKSEINRIADSSNFNGIKLLDGSLAEKTTAGDPAATKLKDALAALTHVADGVADDAPAVKGKFELNLSQAGITNKGADVTITDATAMTPTVTDGTTTSAATIAYNLAGMQIDQASGQGATAKITVAGQEVEINVSDAADMTDENIRDAVFDQLADIEIGGVTYKATKGGAGTATITYTAQANGVTALAAADYAMTAAPGEPDPVAMTAEITVGDKTFSVEVPGASTMSGSDIADAVMKTLEATDGVATIGNVDFNVTNKDGVLTFEMKDDPTASYTQDLTASLVVKDAGGNVVAQAGGANAGVNTQVTVQGEGIGVHMLDQAKPAGQRVQAQATFDLSDASVGLKDGTALKIGNDTYIFAVGSDSKFKDFKGDAKVVDLTHLEADSADLAKEASIRLSKVAQDNKMFDVGTDNTTGVIRLSERKDSGIDYSVNNLEGTTTDNLFDANKTAWKGLIQVGQGNPDAKPSVTSGGLTLQIGEDSQSYNQLTVSVADMHTKALGLDDITLKTQDGAQSAVDVIKNAINSVSSTRGKLGATQNRLEHTQNNLSTMKENIQDAEATIRDTDIAEEMMAYTKNNILVQSAQAMLAQANQIPQGVLQLLG